MLRSVLTGLTFALCATAALAAPKWNGAGWYQIEDVVIDDVVEDGWILAGPFPSKDACAATLPGDDDTFQHSCEYVETQPTWDY